MYIRSESPNNPWLGYSRPNPAASLRIFCFPYAGAGASVFHSWRDSLPSTAEVCPVQLPGRESRLGESPFTSLTPIVEAVTESIFQLRDKPFVLFGHSLGALLSFEVARRLRRQYGLGPVHMFVSGHAAPQIVDRGKAISSLPEPEFLEELRSLNGTPPEVLDHPELREIFLPILRADFAVCDGYVYEREDPLDCPLSAFGGSLDAHVSREHLESWRAQTRASFTVRIFPGDHFFVNTARSLVISSLVRELSQLPGEFLWRSNGDNLRTSVASSS
ncbi:MAG: thioesterase II family protein [Chloroflexi bacterium]|nr:thioesterase II family protein [Chloroflexota bacterium]